MAAAPAAAAAPLARSAAAAAPPQAATAEAEAPRQNAALACADDADAVAVPTDEDGGVPVVRQRFEWDCGIACALMALRALGILAPAGGAAGAPPLQYGDLLAAVGTARCAGSPETLHTTVQSARRWGWRPRPGYRPCLAPCVA